MTFLSKYKNTYTPPPPPKPKPPEKPPEQAKPPEPKPQPKPAPTSVDRNTAQGNADRHSGPTGNVALSDRTPTTKDAAADYVRGKLDGDSLSGGVHDELDNAFKDDENTQGDIRDAAGKVESAADVDAVMAASYAKGHDNQHELLAEMVGQVDLEADPPQTEMVEAIAQHYEGRGSMERAEAVRGLADPNLTKDVRQDVQLALKDGDSRQQDLEDAAKHVKSPEDLEFVMMAAHSGGENVTPAKVINAALEQIDASEPNAEMLGAIADQYEANGQPAKAEVVRQVGGDDIGKDVREHVLKSLYDSENTQGDLDTAAQASRSPAELDLVMASAKLRDDVSQHEVLQGALRGLEEDAETVDAGMEAMLDSIEGHYREAGHTEKADAVGEIKTLDSAEARKEAIHSLQDNDNTTDDHADLGREIAPSSEDAEAGRTVVAGNRTEASDLAYGLGQLDTAQNQYTEAMEAVQKHEQDIAVLRGTPGMTPEQIEAVETRYREEHQGDYDALETSRQAVAEAVEANREVLSDALSDPDSLEALAESEGINRADDPQAFDDFVRETQNTVVDSLEAISQDPDHAELAGEIVTPMLEQAATNPDQIDGEVLGAVMERVAPGVVENGVAKALREQGGEGRTAVEGAFAAFEQTPFGLAAKALDTYMDTSADIAGSLESARGQIVSFNDAYTDLKDMGTGASVAPDGRPVSASQLEGQVEELTASGKFGQGLAALGVTLATISVPDAFREGNYKDAALGTTAAAGDLAGLLAKGGQKLALNHAADYLPIVGDAFEVVSGVQGSAASFANFQETGDNVELARAVLSGASAVAGGLAIASAVGVLSVPGVNVAAVAIMAATLGVNAVENANDKREQSERLMEAVNQAGQRGMIPDSSEAQRQLFAANLSGGEPDLGAVMLGLRAHVHVSDDVANRFMDQLGTTSMPGFDNHVELLEQLRTDLKLNQELHVPAAERGAALEPYRELYEELARDLNVDPADVPPWEE